MTIQFIQPEALVPPSTPYSNVVKVSDHSLVFISGQTAVDSRGETVGSTMDEQMDQIFENLRIALSSVDAGFQNVVKFNSTVKVGCVEEYTSKRKALFPSLFPTGQYPGNSIVIVPELPSPEWLAEIEAIVSIG